MPSMPRPARTNAPSRMRGARVCGFSVACASRAPSSRSPPRPKLATSGFSSTSDTCLLLTWRRQPALGPDSGPRVANHSTTRTRMAPPHAAQGSDQRAIDEIVRAFFDLFTNRSGATPNLRAIFDLCLPEAVISKCVASSPVVTSLEAFIAPREALLSDGSLTDFHEVEV